MYNYGLIVQACPFRLKSRQDTIRLDSRLSFSLTATTIPYKGDRAHYPFLYTGDR